MLQQLPVETLFAVQDGLFGLRYLKIVKSPTGPHFIIDVMFREGFRLTADIMPGQKAKMIGEELLRKLQTYRSHGYDTIKPVVDFVTECASRVLSDSEGNVSECQLRADSIREAWNMTLFRMYLTQIDPERRLSYEDVSEVLGNLTWPNQD